METKTMKRQKLRRTLDSQVELFLCGPQGSQLCAWKFQFTFSQMGYAAAAAELSDS